MKISYNWLNDIIDLRSKNPAEVAQLLTGCGLEVEGIEKYNSIPGGLEGVLVGFVKERIKHPNADKLSVCKVDLGDGKDYQIVCGAPNVAAGQKVLVATVGATIHPSKGEPFKISKSKIRGEVSEGMICAEDELSLGTGHDGILVLPDSYETGKPAANYFHNYRDHIFEIGLTANRGDAASHLGVARDLHALTGIPLQQRYQRRLHAAAVGTSNDWKVEILDKETCIRYSGMLMKGIRVGESPGWIKDKLLSIGLNPINNIVDATNYVLHELGQPLHAFDASKIRNKHLLIKKAEAGSSFITLDKQERKLTGEECMICDSNEPLALAGIFGGLHSGISESTTEIFLESAYFNPASIRRSAKKHGLNTDASFRFERGTDPGITLEALIRVAGIIQEIAGGEVASELIDVYPQPVEPHRVQFSVSKCQRLIGKAIPKDRMLQILQSLEISLKSDAGDILQLEVPPYRPDVSREADICEEILRIYGLNEIEIPMQLRSTIAPQDKSAGINEALKNKVASHLAANGFLEMASNSLVKSALFPEKDKLVRILNPLSTELDVLRPTMLHSALEALSYNRNRRISDLKFFEFGKSYALKSGNMDKVEDFLESEHLLLCMNGNRQAESWNAQAKSHDFYSLKGIAEQVLKRLGIDKIDYEYGDDANLEPSAAIRSGKTILGKIGKVKKELASMYDLQEAWFADLDWNQVTITAKNTRFRLQAVAVYPAVRRDLALLLDKDVKYTTIEKLAYKTEPKLLQDVNVFDVYTGDKIEKGKKSYAIAFTLQAEDKTLTDEEIESVMNKLLAGFKKELGASLRA